MKSVVSIVSIVLMVSIELSKGVSKLVEVK